MCYFRTTPFYTGDIDNIAQFGKVIRFQNKLRELGVYFWQYSEPLEFERAFREHITHQLLKQVPHGESQEFEPSVRILLEANDYNLYEEPPFLITVNTIYDMLKSAGLCPWAHWRDMRPGDFQYDAIEKQARTAEIGVYCLARSTHPSAIGNDIPIPDVNELVIVLVDEEEEESDYGDSTHKVFSLKSDGGLAHLLSYLRKRASDLGR